MDELFYRDDEIRQLKEQIKNQELLAAKYRDILLNISRCLPTEITGRTYGTSISPQEMQQRMMQHENAYGRQLGGLGGLGNILGVGLLGA